MKHSYHCHRDSMAYHQEELLRDGLRFLAFFNLLQEGKNLSEEKDYNLKFQKSYLHMVLWIWNLFIDTILSNDKTTHFASLLACIIVSSSFWPIVFTIVSFTATSWNHLVLALRSSTEIKTRINTTNVAHLSG